MVLILSFEKLMDFSQTFWFHFDFDSFLADLLSIFPTKFVWIKTIPQSILLFPTLGLASCVAPMVGLHAGGQGWTL
jgi:hypothetical protein